MAMQMTARRMSAIDLVLARLELLWFWLVIVSIPTDYRRNFNHIMNVKVFRAVPVNFDFRVYCRVVRNTSLSITIPMLIAEFQICLKDPFQYSSSKKEQQEPADETRSEITYLLPR